MGGREDETVPSIAQATQPRVPRGGRWEKEETFSSESRRRPGEDSATEPHLPPSDLPPRPAGKAKGGREDETVPSIAQAT